MNRLVWISAMAFMCLVGCDTKTEGDAMMEEDATEAPAPPANSGGSSLTRYCCDESLASCDAEPTKACTDESGKPVIVWDN